MSDDEYKISFSKIEKGEVYTLSDLKPALDKWKTITQGKSTKIERQHPGCFIISGHGSDQNLNERSTIYGSILEDWPAFNINIPNFSSEIKDYIKNKVHIIITIGQPGVSSPMGERVKKTWTNIKIDNRSLSTVEGDILTINKYYKLYDDWKVQRSQSGFVPTAEFLEYFNQAIMLSLRENYKKEFVLDQPVVDYMKTHKMWSEWSEEKDYLVKNNEIWVYKSLDENTGNRLYSLYANDEKEEKTLNAHEGILVTNVTEQATVFKTIWDTLTPIFNNLVTSPKTVHNLERNYFDKLKITEDTIANNFKDIIAKKFKINREEYSKDTAAPDDRNSEAFQNFLRNRFFHVLFEKFQKGITKSNGHYIDGPTIQTADLVLMGYLLGIDDLTIFDPVCRPLTYKQSRELRNRTIEHEKEHKILKAPFFVDSLKRQLTSVPPPSGGGGGGKPSHRKKRRNKSTKRKTKRNKKIK